MIFHAEYLFDQRKSKVLILHRPPPKQPVGNRVTSVSTPVSYQQRPQQRTASISQERGNPFRRGGREGGARPRQLPSLDEEEGYTATNGEEAQPPEEDMEPGQICPFGVPSDLLHLQVLLAGQIGKTPDR